MAIRLRDLTRTRTIFDTLDERDWKQWTDWQGLYRNLLAEDRIWDFRDVLFALSESCSAEDALVELVGSASPLDQMLADWVISPPDESTSLAILDILSFIALNAKIPGKTQAFPENCLRSAEHIGNSILDNFPRAVHTRPFIRWMLAKALIKSSRTHFDYLLDHPGQAFFQTLEEMPYYIPVFNENPKWRAPKLITIVRESLEMALSSFKQMLDFQSEAWCLKELALGTKAPGAIFDDLAHLQKSKQLDKAGYLSTCLSRYLICNDVSSKASPLRDLETFGWCHNPSDAINPNAAAAKDVLQRALSQEDVRGAAKSMEAALRYYEYLETRFAKTIDRNISPSSRKSLQIQGPRERMKRDMRTKRDEQRKAEERRAKERRAEERKIQEKTNVEEQRNAGYQIRNQMAREEEWRHRRVEREEYIRSEVQRRLQAHELRRIENERREQEREAEEERREEEFQARIEAEVARRDAVRRHHEETERRARENRQAHDRKVADDARLEFLQEQDDERKLRDERQHLEKQIRDHIRMEERARAMREREGPEVKKNIDIELGRRALQEQERKDAEARQRAQAEVGKLGRERLDNEAETRHRNDEIHQQEDEARRQEDEVRRREFKLRQSATEARHREDEAPLWIDEVRRRSADLRQRETETRHRETETRYQHDTPLRRDRDKVRSLSM